MNISPLNNLRIGVATAYGKPYFRFVNSLKELDLRYDSFLPEHIPAYTGNLVFTTRDEAPLHAGVPLLFEDVFEKHPTVLAGIILEKLELNFEREELVIGVDPGSRIGLSIFYYGIEIESSLYSSVEELVLHIIAILAGLKAKTKIVKIGNGNMPIAREIGNLLNLKFCSSFELEFVDERRTSLKIKNYNQRGRRDRLSAKYITQRQGYRHFVLPLSITG